MTRSFSISVEGDETNVDVSNKLFDTLVEALKVLDLEIVSQVIETGQYEIDDDETVLRSIQSGQYDETLIMMKNEIQYRIDHLAVQKGHQLRPGDRVRIISGRPHYIHGSAATVERVMQSYVSIKLDISVGKFRAGTSIRCPMTMIEKIQTK